MPKMVCSACEVQLVPSENGVILVEYASFGPYKAWEADEWKCPRCGHEIVAGFATNPFVEHWQEHFSEAMEQMKRIGRTIRHSFENARQRLDYIDNRRDEIV